MVKTGITMIIFKGKEREDLEYVLNECKKAGYNSIETGILFDIYTIPKIKEIFQKLELEYVAIHSRIETFQDQVSLNELIKNSLEVGVKHLICSGLRKEDELDKYKEAAFLFNKVGEECKKVGITFWYHNHCWEFIPRNRERGIDILEKETDPTVVKFNIDVAWVYIANIFYKSEEPTDLIEKFKDRVGFYHFKDAILQNDRIIWTELGKGEVPLENIYKSLLKYNPGYIIYEQDETQIDVRKAITESREYLRKLGLT